MFTIMQHVSGLWGEVFAWAAILIGLAVLASLITRIDRRRPEVRRTDAADTASPGTARKLEREREWELVMRRAREDLSRGAELAALQADTALKIASAEHAYNRLVADCARLCGVAAAPPPAPTGPAIQVVGKAAPGEPNKAAEPRPLAA
ncbi:MAG TPA: hypothetical protein VH913_23395 [Hyphomicrobiaceae bacterium]|jgi:hypothetical protein